MRSKFDELDQLDHRLVLLVRDRLERQLLAFVDLVERRLVLGRELEHRRLDLRLQVGRQLGEVSHRRVDDLVRLENDPEVGSLRHALAVHAQQVGLGLVVPPVERRIAGALGDRDHRILVAAGIDDLGEELVRIDAHLVHGKARHVVAGGRVGIDQAEVLALQVFELLERRVLLHVEHRVVALGAVGADFDRERLDLDAGDVGARVGRRARTSRCGCCRRAGLRSPPRSRWRREASPSCRAPSTDS